MFLHAVDPWPSNGMGKLIRLSVMVMSVRRLFSIYWVLSTVLSGAVVVWRRSAPEDSAVWQASINKPRGKGRHGIKGENTSV